MIGEAVRIEVVGGMVRVELARPERRNTIDALLIDALHHALDLAESLPDCRVVVLENTGDTFCAGMDLIAAGQASTPDPADAVADAERFSGLMRRFTTLPRIVVSRIDGQVAGGGVGIAAASDLVLATPRSSFSLPEALWGLLPCCIAPYLIRRVGFQKSYALALTTQPVTAAQAAGWQLVDEVAEHTEPVLRRLAFRASKIEAATITHLKRYFGQLVPIEPDHERLAARELASLMSSPTVRGHLEGFARDHRFPWELP